MSAIFPATNLFVVKNKINIEPMEPLVRLALAGLSEGPVFSILEKITHGNDVIRVLAGVLYFRYHQITEPMIPLYLAPPRHHEGGPNYTADRQRALTWVSNFQLNILNWYRAGVIATCDVTGGKTHLEQIIN